MAISALSLVSQLGAAAGRQDVAKFVSSLATESPLLSYFNSVAAERVGAGLGSGRDVLSSDDWGIVAAEAPLVYATACALGGRDAMPSCMLGLLRELSSVALASIEGGTVPPCHADPSQPSCGGNDCLLTGVCCGVRKVRGRPQYAADGGEDESKSDCRHAFHKGPARTGGIFTWFCEHGVCYGFYILNRAEGRDEAFSFLTTHFEEAPETVVYDFACALQEYCLNRAPQFFKHTRFVVDRFHWLGHKSCAAGYNMAWYPSLRFTNSSIAEQCNAALKRVKASVTRMSQVPFMLSLRLFLDVWNRKKIEFLTACELLQRAL